MELSRFGEEVRCILEKQGLLTEKGRILYSAARTLRKGDFYVLGFNPGGLSSMQGTIEENLKGLTKSLKDLRYGKDEDDFDEILDGRWGNQNQGGYEAGEHPLQVHLTGC